MIPDEAVEAAAEYCDWGVCERSVDRLEWSDRRAALVPVCNEHGDRIAKENGATK